MAYSHRSALVAGALFLATVTGCGWLTRQATIAYISVNSHFSADAIEIEIRRSFLERYKDRVGIVGTVSVDKAMRTPLDGAIDGDLHFAGRSPQVALPLVAEIINASVQDSAVAAVHAAERSGKPLRMAGVWRIWPEHPGKAEEEQGKPLPAFESYAPDHVFEIHPLTRVNDIPLERSFTPVRGFSPGGARRTFEIYEKAHFTLRVKPKSVSLIVETGLYNDVEFIMELVNEPQLVVEDGRFVAAVALDLSGKPVVTRLRMVFAKGTPPELAVRELKAGGRLHVYGIPRVDFAEISRRVQGYEADPSLLTKPLPYEIIVLGVFPK